MNDSKNKIISGLKDATAFTRGDNVGARVTTYSAEDRLRAALSHAEQALSYVREDLCGQNLRIVDAAIKSSRAVLNPVST